jgi:septum formation protein
VTELILASASPRRRELLERVGVRFRVAPADVDETPIPGEKPPAYVARVALAKAKAAAAASPGAWVLAADTTVVIGMTILGKAADEKEATAMLKRLSGRTHQVLTATYLLGPDGKGSQNLVTTDVVMRPLLEPEIAAYVACGEWRGKAGAYAVQGIASAFIVVIRGSYTNVVGLPLAEVVSDLTRRGAPGPDLSRGIPA